MSFTYAGQYGPVALCNDGGVPQPNLPVTVYQSDGVTAATLYTDRTKATTTSNNIATDAKGDLEFFADPGQYVLGFSIATSARTLAVPVPIDPAEPLRTVAAPTGVAATDAGNIQAAHDALPATGGALWLQAGTYALGTVGLNFTKRVRLAGAGPADALWATFGTLLTYTSPTGVAITVGAGGSELADLAVQYTGGTTPTAGAGIKVTSGNGLRLVDVAVRGFYDNLDVDNAAEWYGHRCFSYDPVRYGWRVRNTGLPDGGDMGIIDCQIIAGPTNAAPTAAISWESGGGLRLIGCKVNNRTGGKFGTGLSTSMGSPTGVLVVDGCSIENVTGNGINIVTTGSATFNNLVVANTEIGLYANTTGAAVVINAAAAGNIANVLIDNLVVAQSGASSRYAVELTNVSYSKVGKIQCSSASGFVGRASLTSCTAVRADPPTTGDLRVVVGSAAGDYTTTATTYQTIPGFTATVAATAGDVIEIEFSGEYYHNTAGGSVNVQATVQGTARGARSMYAATALKTEPFTLQALYTVQAADLTSGTVSMSVQYCSAAAGTAAIANAAGGRTPTLKVRNLGVPST